MRIEESAAGLVVGALVKNSDLADHPAVRARYPVLSEALAAGASPQLRNMATVGGNLMQRTRCAYFRNCFPSCNKRSPGSGCAALDGYNRSHAVLGVSGHCIATHPSDMSVALVALDAVVHTQSARGTRQIPIADFHLLPGAHPERETVLDKGELVTHVVLPRTGFSARSRYVKVRDRASYDFALASAAVALETEAGLVRQARVALGGGTTKPWRSIEAEKALLGRPADRASFERAAARALEGAAPRAHNAFKVALMKSTLVRALESVGAPT
jgi:xanthine dehydrogenase YagS FAD-binding subunit